VLGREVAVVTEGVARAGTHDAALDVSRLQPGLYVVRLIAGGQALSRSLTVAR